MSRWLNRTVGNQQLGFMLAFLARKVLGQYDVSLLAAGPTRGRLNFVEPNIVGTAATMRHPAATSSAPSSLSTRRPTPSSSRRTHGCGRTSPTSVGRAVEPLAAESGGLMAAPARGAVERRGPLAGADHDARASASTFNSTQALMSLLEGYSNHVMNAAGEKILPGFTEIHDRFERRNERRGRAREGDHAPDRARPEDGAVRRR